MSTQVAVTTVLDTPGNFNGDYVEGFLDVTFSSAVCACHACLEQCLRLQSFPLAIRKRLTK